MIKQCKYKHFARKQDFLSAEIARKQDFSKTKIARKQDFSPQKPNETGH